MHAVEQSIRRFIIDSFRFGQDDPSLKDDASLLSHGVIDSTGVMELVMHLEKTYQIKVEDEELTPDNLDSVHKIAQYIRGKQAPLAQTEKDTVYAA